MRYSNNEKQDELTHIKIVNKKSEFLCIVIAFLLGEVPMIIAIVCEEKAKIACSIIGIIWACILLLATLYTAAYVVNIEGTAIWGRTDTGKKFRFDCSDIRKITYRHYNGGYRSRKCTILVIETDDMKIGLDSAMSGYKEATEYLLKMQQKGFISQKSISAADAKSIKRENKARKK